jgi:hypothetical protein
MRTNAHKCAKFFLHVAFVFSIFSGNFKQKIQIPDIFTKQLTLPEGDTRRESPGKRPPVDHLFSVG